MRVFHALISSVLVGALFLVAACGVELDTNIDIDIGTAIIEEVSYTEESMTIDDGDSHTDPGVECHTATEIYTFNNSAFPYVDAWRNGVRIARFSLNSRTVTVLGYKDRSFSTTDTDGSAVEVQHAWYVRTLPGPFTIAMSHTAMTAWVRAARQANCDGDKDVLTIASQYSEGRRQVWSGRIRVAGDARFALGCDFHDYTGTTWLPPDGRMLDADLSCQADGLVPDPDRNPNASGSLDCSGFIRTVYSSRNNFSAMLGSYSAHIDTSYFRYPLTSWLPASHLPRMSHDQYRYGPGRKIVPFRVAAAPTRAELDRLLPGDLVFFNLSDSQATHPCCEPSTPNRDDTCCEDGITHVGLFMGLEQESGKYRIMSSRDSMSGPTMGGTSYLNVDTNDGWSKRFRAARRL